MKKISIQALNQKVNEEKSKGKPSIATLKKYGVSSRAYCTQCKRNGITNWSNLNSGKIVIRKKSEAPKRELGGGSLERPKKGNKDLMKRVTFDLRKEQKIDRQIRELDI